MADNSTLPMGVRTSARAVVKRVEDELVIVQAINRRAAFFTGTASG